MVYYLNAVCNKNEILFVACVHICTYSSEDSNNPMGFESPMVDVPVLYIHIVRASNL